jgi:hypothetical protein
MQDHGYSKEAENVPLDGQASCLPSGDACCLRDGAYTSRLATLVQDGLSSAVHNHGDSGVGLCVAEVSELLRQKNICHAPKIRHRIISGI